MIWALSLPRSRSRRVVRPSVGWVSFRANLLARFMLGLSKTNVLSHRSCRAANDAASAFFCRWDGRRRVDRPLRSPPPRRRPLLSSSARSFARSLANYVTVRHRRQILGFRLQSDLPSFCAGPVGKRAAGPGREGGACAGKSSRGGGGRREGDGGGGGVGMKMNTLLSPRPIQHSS